MEFGECLSPASIGDHTSELKMDEEIGKRSECCSPWLPFGFPATWKSSAPRLNGTSGNKSKGPAGKMNRIAVAQMEKAYQNCSDAHRQQLLAKAARMQTEENLKQSIPAASYGVLDPIGKSMTRTCHSTNCTTQVAGEPAGEKSGARSDRVAIQCLHEKFRF